MLPSFVNPKPLTDQGHPDTYSQGHPTEAYMVLQDAVRAFARVPDAEGMLIQRFGRNPVYNHNLRL